ncbi:MAG: sigma-70 family RNA polymerase sigma factor [Dehalococcoidia bacterium]|nr:sigma-70 family RNA polymerase sigma factor [Dehalococcoidia bacterium]
MTDSTSGTLLERFRARDEGALADLYDLMGARAYGLAFRVLHDGAAAEDVVQNAFATLWEQADRLDPGRGSIEGLLLTIVHRRAVDAARSRQRQSTRSAPLDVDPADGDPTPMEVVVADDEAAERAREVRAALQVLPEAQREVVMLSYFEGLSQIDIAARIEVPLGTVKSRLRLAMQRLRYELGTVEAEAETGATDGA